MATVSASSRSRSGLLSVSVVEVSAAFVSLSVLERSRAFFLPETWIAIRHGIGCGLLVFGLLVVQAWQPQVRGSIAL